MADRRESKHPGIYANMFNLTKRILLAAGVPGESVLGQARIVAEKAVSRRLAVEESFHKSAADIVDAGKAIIEEKGWSSVAGKGNLAEQLGGKLQDSKEGDLSGHTRSLTFLGRLSSVADFLPEDSLPELDENTPKGMFELFINFGHKLGVFIPDSEEEKAAIVRFEKYFNNR